MDWWNNIHWFGVFSLVFTGVIFYLLSTVKGFKKSSIRKPSIAGWVGSSLEVSYLSFTKFGFNQTTGIITVCFLLFALINVIIVFVTKSQPIHNTKWYKNLFKIVPRLGIWIYFIILIINQILVL